MPYLSLEDSSLGKYLSTLQAILSNILQETKTGCHESTKEYHYSLNQLQIIANALSLTIDCLSLFSKGSKPSVFALLKRYMSGDFKKTSSEFSRLFANPVLTFFKQLFDERVQLIANLSIINETNHSVIKTALNEAFARKAEGIMRDENHHPAFDPTQCLIALETFINDYQLSDDHKTIEQLSQALIQGFTDQYLARQSPYQFQICHQIAFDFSYQVLELSATLPERLDDLLGFLDPEILKSTFFSAALQKLAAFLKRFSDIACPDDSSLFKFMCNHEEIDPGHYYRGFKRSLLHHSGLELQHYIDRSLQSKPISVFVEKMTLVNHYIFKQQQEKQALIERGTVLLNSMRDLNDNNMHECDLILSHAQKLEQQTENYYKKSFIELISDYPELTDFFWSWHRGQDQSTPSDFKLPHYILWSGYSEQSTLVSVVEQLTCHDRQLMQCSADLNQLKNRLIVSRSLIDSEKESHKTEVFFIENQNELKETLDARRVEHDLLLIRHAKYQQRIKMISEEIKAFWQRLPHEQHLILDRMISRRRLFLYPGFFSASTSSSTHNNEPLPIASFDELNHLLTIIKKQKEGQEVNIQNLRFKPGGLAYIQKRLNFLDTAKACFVRSPDKIPSDELDRAFYIMWIPGLAWWNKGRGLQWLLTCMDLDIRTEMDRDAMEALLDQTIASHQQLMTELDALSEMEQQLIHLTAIELFIENNIYPLFLKLNKVTRKLAAMNTIILRVVEDIEQITERIEDIEHEIAMQELIQLKHPAPSF